MTMREMTRMSGQTRDEILCENWERDPAYDERSMHGSPYADFVTEDGDEEEEVDDE